MQREPRHWALCWHEAPHFLEATVGGGEVGTGERWEPEGEAFVSAAGPPTRASAFPWPKEGLSINEQMNK